MARSKQGTAPNRPKPQKTRQTAYLPPRESKDFDTTDPRLQELCERLPSGTVAVLANESARYTVFQAACMGLLLPLGSRFSFHTGCYVVDSCNRAISSIRIPEDDWIMFMGDDHVFPPNLALKLLALMYKDDLDVIAPLCFKRDFPPTPVLYRLGDPKDGLDMSKYAYDAYSKKVLYPINLNAFPEGGVIEVDGAGSAGMIVRTRVLAKIEPPWFRIGDGQWGEDLDFCRRAQMAGFKIHADLDMSLGHIVNTSIWPTLTEEGWACQYDFGNKGGFALAI